MHFVYLSIIKKIRDMKELNAIEKLELAEATMKALGFDFSELTVEEAFQIFHAIKNKVSDTLAEQMETFERNV